MNLSQFEVHYDGMYEIQISVVYKYILSVLLEF